MCWAPGVMAPSPPTPPPPPPPPGASPTSSSMSSLSSMGHLVSPGMSTRHIDHLLPFPGTSSFPLVTPTLGTLPPPSALSSIPLLSSSASLPPLYTSSIRHEATMAVSSGPTASTWSSPPVTSTVTPPQFPLVVGGTFTCPPTPPMGIILSPSSEPFPQRLVDRARSGQFVDMREFLTDNVALLQQLEVFPGTSATSCLPGVARPRLRDITSLPSWLYFFLAYAAIITQDPATRDHLTYARLMIREAQRHGGNGWLDYDRVFRQQVAIDRTLQWNTLHPGLQASTILGQRTASGSFCNICRESDHSSQQCALSYLHQTTPQSQPSSQPPQVRLTSNNDPQRARRPMQIRRRPESLLQICVSWNNGLCVYPGTCTYKHICATCQADHKAKDCPDTPEGSEYKSRPRRALGSSSSKL